ncbi:hypothetical protein [Paraburkholderia sp. RL17-337-BIB-A]|uniref:hypothetical protein n=1 Tax=Paraburkholderia sp. RL17-337-BIB-A TaxID=3031636 RepID=UPI0038BA09BF
MSDVRPAQPSEYVETTQEKNDKLIVNALADLEDPKKRGKRKATVDVLCQITGLSINTIRGRKWALTRLRTIKRKIKEGCEEESGEKSGVVDNEPTLDSLRGRVIRALEQNALLFNEVLSLREIIADKDRQIKELKAGKILSLVPPTGRRTE